MERGVEHGDLRRLGHDSLAGANAHQVGGVVQGAQRDALLDGGDDLVIDDAGVEELHAAVQDAMAHGIDLVGGLNNTVNRVNQNVQNRGDGLGMGGHGDILDNLLAVCVVGQAAVNVDTLAQALGGYHAGIGIHQLILEGRGTGIDNQNVHGNLPPKYFCFLVWNFMI